MKGRIEVQVRVPTLSNKNYARHGISDWELDAAWEQITQASNDRAQEAAIKNATNFVLKRLNIDLDATDIKTAANLTLVDLISDNAKAPATNFEKAALIKAAFKTKLGNRVTDILRIPEQFKRIFLDKLTTAYS